MLDYSSHFQENVDIPRKVLFSLQIINSIDLGEAMLKFKCHTTNSRASHRYALKPLLSNFQKCLWRQYTLGHNILAHVIPISKMKNKIKMIAEYLVLHAVAIVTITQSTSRPCFTSHCLSVCLSLSHPHRKLRLK